MDGQDYCKVRYRAAISYVMEAWALDAVHVPCDGTLETTDDQS
ncbi:hypothetical protein [Endothiovibrio diazotrophicus]